MMMKEILIQVHFAIHVQQDAKNAPMMRFKENLFAHHAMIIII